MNNNNNNNNNIGSCFIKIEYFKIDHLKTQLQQTDYKAIKYAEGLISEEEYAPIKAERQSIRDQINELEASLAEKE